MNKNLSKVIVCVGVVLSLGLLGKNENEHKPNKNNEKIINFYNEVLYKGLNSKQNFQMRLPAIGKWEQKINIDEKNFFDGTYFINEEDNDVYFSIQINLFSEITPPFPKRPFCKQNREILFLQNIVLASIYSSYYSKNEDIETACDLFLEGILLNEHSICAMFCLDKELKKVYPAELIMGKEFSYNCIGGDDFYSLSLICNGKDWKRKEGREKCFELFKKITYSFKFSGEDNKRKKER